MIGKLLGDRYEVQQRIGGGGMAIVYKAQDRLLNRPVAVKVLRAQFGQDEDFIHRFRREAQSAARLSHPNIVNVYDVGEEDDTYYIVMEYVDGVTLKQLISEKGPLDVREAVDYAIQICDGLDHAHQNQIVHRDIKPHNILISRNGRVKVTDFGIARAVTSSTITHTGSVIGSVHYFSPEQAKGGMIGEKSDIYSLGIVLYEMLTGKLPFSGDSPITVALKHLQEDFPRPRELYSSIPQSLENVIMRALAKDPKERYDSVREMEQDLKTVLSPERLDEAPLASWSQKVNDDEEPTRIVPSLSLDMMDTIVAKDDREPEKKNIGKFSRTIPQMKIWMKPALWIVALLVMVGIGVLGFNYARGILYVPDVSTPSVENKTVEAAIAELKSKGLTPVVKESYDSVVKKGFVIKQNPVPGMVVKEKAEVTIFVSKGKKEVSMPDLRGLSQSTVEKQLVNTFAEIKIKTEKSDTVAPGRVIDQEPAPDKMVVPEDTTVTLIISEGAKTIQMPNLIGMNRDEAESVLLANDLKLGEIDEEKGYQDPGRIFWQFPYNPGDEVPTGSEISVKISTGYPDEAREVYYPVQYTKTGDDPVDVTILVTDARGEEQMQVNETIRKDRIFQVHLVLSPDQDGYIMIYENGSLWEKKKISYRDQ